MTPLQKLLAQVAKRSGVLLGVIERDFAQGYLLEALAADPALASTLVFKGGTALKKVYFGDAYRFSEDLDFTAIGAPAGGALEAALTHVVRAATTRMSALSPVASSLARLTYGGPHPGGQEAFAIDIRYPWHRSPMCRVKVEVTPDERVVLAPTARAVIHGYEGGVNGEVLCYAIEEILAEKLRALRQTDAMLVSRGWHRPRVRDYYDLWKILSTFGATIDAATVRRILPEKFVARGVSYSAVGDFFTDRLVHEARVNWQEKLGRLTPDLVPVDRVLADLPGLVADLLRS